MDKTALNATKILKSFGEDKWNLHYNEFLFMGTRGVRIQDETLFYNENTIDEWNDTITVFDKDGFVLHQPGTVDPGMHYSLNPLNSKGAARIEPGLHLLTPGLHKGKEAFIQYSKITVRRDSNSDLIWDESDWVESGWFGIHLHAAYDLKTVGTDSGGCVVTRLLWSDPIWTKEFIERSKRSKQKRIILAIVDPKELALWIGQQRLWS